MFLVYLLAVSVLVSFCFYFLSILRPQRPTLTHTLFPYTTLFRSLGGEGCAQPKLALKESSTDALQLGSTAGDRLGLDGVAVVVEAGACDGGAGAEEGGQDPDAQRTAVVVVDEIGRAHV